MKLTPRILAFSLIVMVLVAMSLAFGLVVETRCYPLFPPGVEITYSQLLHDVETGRLREVIIHGSEVHGTRHDGGYFATDVPTDPTTMQSLYKLL